VIVQEIIVDIGRQLSIDGVASRPSIWSPAPRGRNALSAVCRSVCRGCARLWCGYRDPCRVRGGVGRHRRLIGFVFVVFVGLAVFVISQSSSASDSESSSQSSSSSDSESGASAEAATATSDVTAESTPTGGTKGDRTIQLKVSRHADATAGRTSAKTVLDEEDDDSEGSSITRRVTSHSSDGDADEPTQTEPAGTSNLATLEAQPISAVAVAADDPPPADSPDELVVPAVARHEPFDYTLDIRVNDGVITGTNTSSQKSDWNNPLTYTVIGAPVAGGKVNLDETSGSFTFLPYTADSTPDGADEFRVLVTETTWFDSALEQVPILKYFVKPILLSLHQIPILKEVLAPLIGRSMVETVNINVDSFVGEDLPPIAFTTTVESFDGTPISVNWFPKSGLT
jgi:ABC-2 type transport system ATP-binding protein